MTRYKLVAALIFAATLTSLCSRSSKAEAALSSVASEVTLSSMESKLYRRGIQTDNAKYFVDNSCELTDEEIDGLVDDSEVIRLKLAALTDGMTDLPLGLDINRTIIYTGDIENTHTANSFTSAAICPEEARGGMLIYLYSCGEFPAWLCAGLEAVWLDDRPAEAADIDAWSISEPPFGDIWFMPCLFNENVYSISYSFVKHLNDNGQLKDLVREYLGESTEREANNMFRLAWKDFSGQDNGDKGEIVYRYQYDLSLSDYVSLAAYGEHGDYYFANIDWPLEMIRRYTELSESGIKFAEDWLGSAEYGCYSVVFDNASLPYGGASFSDNSIIVTATNKSIIPKGQDVSILGFPQPALIHEVVHKLLERNGIFPDFPSAVDPEFNVGSRNNFVEGLCTMIGLLHFREPVYDKYAAALNDIYTYDYMITNLGSDSVELQSPEIINSLLRPEEGGGKRVSMVNAYHLASSLIVYERLSKFEKDAAEMTQDELTSLINVMSATSFLSYMYDLSESNDEFLRVYEDLDLAEECYGVTFEQMLRDWIEYLKVYVKVT